MFKGGIHHVLKVIITIPSSSELLTAVQQAHYIALSSQARFINLICNNKNSNLMLTQNRNVSKIEYFCSPLSNKI